MMNVRLLIAALIVASSPLNAEPPRSAVQVVSFGNLDLTRSQDRATLDRQLASAALHVCRGLAVGSPFDRQVVAGCWRRTLAEAREQAALAIARARSRSLLARNAPAR